MMIRMEEPMTDHHGRKNYAFLIIIFLLGSCREFYDADFEQDQLEVTSTSEDTSYEAELLSTNSALTEMSGDASVDIQNNTVNVELSLNGIPANVVQVHYGYVSAPCSSLATTFATDLSSTRTYSVTEESTTDALAVDLSSSGASSGSGDTNLNGKTFVVKAFTNFSGTPSPTGTNEIVIACGQLNFASNSSSTTTTTIDTSGTDTTIDTTTTTDSTFDTTTFP